MISGNKILNSGLGCPYERTYESLCVLVVAYLQGSTNRARQQFKSNYNAGFSISKLANEGRHNVSDLHDHGLLLFSIESGS